MPLLRSGSLKHNKLNKDLIVATNGEEAMKALQGLDRGNRPLLIIDITSPTSVASISYLIKSDKDLSNIPVVILTGSNEDQDIQKSYDLGASSYLVKPISSDALMLVIEKLFYPDARLLAASRFPRSSRRESSGVSRIIGVRSTRDGSNCPKTRLTDMPETYMLMSIQMRSQGPLQSLRCISLSLSRSMYS